MTDDYIETHFDLLVISSLIRDFDIEIDIIPKNGFHENDMSFEDLTELIHSDIFPELNYYSRNGKLKISPYGPKMGAANVRRLSPETVSLITASCLLFAKGCRIHEMLQGGLSVHFFSSFYVVRKISESISGFHAKDHEAMFFHLSPNEYAFWGIAYKNSRRNGDDLFCCSTIFDHMKRRTMTNIEEIAAEFSKLCSLEKSYIGDKFPLYQEMYFLSQKMERYIFEKLKTT